jgi:hypothetical protein
VNQKKRKIYFKRRKYVNYLNFFIYPKNNTKKCKKTNNSAKQQKKTEKEIMAATNISTGAPSYPMASLYVGKFEYISHVFQ